MKNGFYFLGGLLLLAGACTAPDSYRLVGNLSGLADGTRMLLVPAATHKQEKPTVKLWWKMENLFSRDSYPSRGC